MKHYIYIVFALFLSISLTSCSSDPTYKGDPVGKIVNVESILANNNTEILAELYQKHGNFINSKQFPPIINAVDLEKNLSNCLLIDIRSKEAYEAGHIEGAYNVQKDKIIDFLTEQQNPAVYDKVVVICYSGQMASYVTGVLRYSGFNNTFVLLHGMAAWNKDFAGILKKNFGIKFRDMIVQTSDDEETKTHAKEAHAKEGHDKAKQEAHPENLPNLDKNLPTTTLLGRARQLLKNPKDKFLISADFYFKNLKNDPDKYYTIMYLNKAKYDQGHIKGSHLYTSRKDLSYDGKLTDLPKDKPIVIYCKSGHTGSNATAYLQMLGYDARNLMFGTNAFGFDIFNQNIDDLSSDFPVLEGAKRTKVEKKPKKVLKTKEPAKTK
jgi:rhodanese-related sulfurtransferase